jgi:hypothetical protein
MGADSRFWLFFGGIWLVVGLCFVAASLGVNLFADPEQLNDGTPLWVFAAVGIVAAGAGGAVVYLRRQSAARDRQLMQTGVPVMATVIDIRRSRIDINREARWHVRYRYQYMSEGPLESESRALAGDAVQGFRPGDQVRIKVDPRRPNETLFLGPV